MLNKMIKNLYQRGITLLEVLVVISIIGIILAIALPQFSKIRNTQILKGAGEEIVAMLSKARSQTLSSLNSSEYGVHFEVNRIILYKGTSYESTDAENSTIDITSPVTISNISLSNGATDVYFNRLNGMPSQTGYIVISISSDESLTKTISISATGSISIN